MERDWSHEFRYSLYTPGKLHSVAPTFLDSNRIDVEGFTSIYSVDERTAEAIQQAGTTISFKGVVWSDTLWIDVDSYDQASEVEAKLKELGYAYVAYDTGGRGAHFGIHLSCAPSHVLPYQCKAWVAEHFGALGADLSIYTHLHLFRLPGTHHERTGRPKELVGRYEGRALVLPRWEPKAGSLALSGVASPTSYKNSILDNYRVLANSVPARNGERHTQLVRLAYALKDGQGLDADRALWWANEVNKLFEEPKDEAEVEKLILSIYR
jgi:hypothetical protein